MTLIAMSVPFRNRRAVAEARAALPQALEERLVLDEDPAAADDGQPREDEVAPPRRRMVLQVRVDGDVREADDQPQQGEEAHREHAGDRLPLGVGVAAG